MTYSKPKETGRHDRRTLYSALRIRSLSLMPKADAMALATSIPTLTLPNSIELIYVRCTLARSANSS
jgi:hypothetical protein